MAMIRYYCWWWFTGQAGELLTLRAAINNHHWTKQSCIWTASFGSLLMWFTHTSDLSIVFSSSSHYSLTYTTQRRCWDVYLCYTGYMCCCVSCMIQRLSWTGCTLRSFGSEDTFIHVFGILADFSGFTCSSQNKMQGWVSDRLKIDFSTY